MSETQLNNLDELDSVSKRLKYVVDNLGVKQSHMAKKLGVSPSGLHYILNNDVKFSKNAKKIADYLNVNQQWLETGKGAIYQDQAPIQLSRAEVGVYYPDQLQVYYSQYQRQPALQPQGYITSQGQYTQPLLGLYVTQPHFSPKFEIGDKLIFEQVSDFQDGDIVLFYLADQHYVTLMYGFHVADQVVLLAPDGQSVELRPHQGHQLVGVYRECFKQANK